MKIQRRFLGALALLSLIVVAAAAAQTFNPQDVIPFDKAVRTAALPNGLNYYVRQNSRPAKRVALRLAVKAGSIDEADDQQGLAHLIEHMAFNGSAHFKPGELVSYFESTGARLGPHVNAYTSFDETVYMLELPTDKPEIVTKGLHRARRLRGRPHARARRNRQGTRRRHRGMARRPRRRLADPRQAVSDPLLQVALRRSPADRQARDPPDRARRRGCAPSTTPGTGPSGWPSSPSATSMRRRSKQRSRPRSAG